MRASSNPLTDIYLERRTVTEIQKVTNPRGTKNILSFMIKKEEKIAAWDAALVEVIQVLNEPSIGFVGHSEPVDVAGRFFLPKPQGRCSWLLASNRTLSIA